MKKIERLQSLLSDVVRDILKERKPVCSRDPSIYLGDLKDALWEERGLRFVDTEEARAELRRDWRGLERGYEEHHDFMIRLSEKELVILLVTVKLCLSGTEEDLLKRIVADVKGKRFKKIFGFVINFPKRPGDDPEIRQV